MNTPNQSEPAANTPLEPAGSEAAPPRTHRWGLGAFFFAQAIFVLVSVTLAAALGSPDGMALVLMLVLPTVLAGAVAVLITIVRGNGPRLDFGLEWRWSDVTTGLAIGGIGLVTTTIATMLWAQWMGPDAQSTVSGLLDGVQLPPALAVVIFLHVWLVAPLCEELLYRGLLWGAMERLRWSQLNVFVLSTAVFAIGHLEPERTALLLVIAIPIGVARMVTGRLTASVVAHQVNNFLPALGLLLLSLGLLPT
ncbi:CPBP family intramembrane glutamic endopeptidase [Saccharopolyspora elongata]|uniref:CPBP family intramembrane metalloprotease n=1 Tax=Saccharopolyspora elongata TaxID=2530387 RepID=A0A4R4Z4W5_9PSEU|nr:type II CAAX endopeptidase family protein [Saccharopolyspora elongata]TDD51999.1 CPBP family intramembrane metalloprotease [Saccharopolyspora elongata]